MNVKLEKVEGPFKSHHEANRAVLEGLIESGTRKAKRKEILNFFYFNNKVDCLAAADELQDIGFDNEEIAETEYCGEKNWLLTCWIVIPLTEDSANRLTDFLDSLAQKYGGIYDGWEIKLDKEEYSKLKKI